ncbi:hypothetical protein IAT38_007186 [Cryptococcus sp. DSM 104549]
MTILATLAAIGMAAGPPLVYADQAYSMVKKKDSSGFSHDVCGVVIIANITRVFFWLGNRFETPLLIQSLLLIISQLGLLAICLHYSPTHNTQQTSYAPLSPLPPSPNPNAERASSPSPVSPSSPHAAAPRSPGLGGMIKGLRVGQRPFSFWQWEGYGSYLEFLAGLIVVLGVMQVILGRWMWYIDALGFVALTIESTLPIPQFLSNWRSKSCYGFRSSTLAGWFFGDSFKTVYFFMRGSPIQFKVTAIMLVCWDTAVFAQRIIYGARPPSGGGNGVQLDNDDAEGEHDEARRLNPGGR